jgi:uncharacterized protein YrrD
VLIAYSDLIHLPVTSEGSGDTLGTVTDLVADATQHRLLAFVVRTGRWFGQTKLLSLVDCRSLTPAGVSVQSTSALVARAELVRISELTPSQTRVIGRAVVTTARRRIGSVTDFVIEPETAGIVRYHVSSLFGPQRIVPTSAVVRVTEQAFVVRADTDSVVLSTEAIATRLVPQSGTVTE